MNIQRVTVVNSSHAELDELAGELGVRGLLHQYFGRYFPNDRPWERALLGFGPMRNAFQKGPGRRVAPRGLLDAERFQPGALLDFAAGTVPRNSFRGRGEHLFRSTLR